MERRSILFTCAFALFVTYSTTRYLSAEDAPNNRISETDKGDTNNRITPADSRGGKPLPEPWLKTPAAWQKLSFPNWPLPTNLQRWKESGRAEVRKTLLECLGDLPKRPNPKAVKVLSREDKGDYWLETFEFHNGLDALVPGILLLPKQSRGAVPAVIGLHGFGGSAHTICTDLKSSQCIGPRLARKGYAVAAIDTYFCGRRSPGGLKDADSPLRYRGASEGSLFRLNLWMGRNLWGLMQRDQQCLIDYLQTRTEIDAQAIGVTGMSMGGTGSWWLAALDDRIKVVVGIAGFTRYRELLAIHKSTSHGVYYFVPNLLKHFDTEAIFALAAPRPMLMLSGDRDAGAPLAGVEILEERLARVYTLHEAPNRFRSIVYTNTGHEYLPEMQTAMVQWFEKHLPVRKQRL